MTDLEAVESMRRHQRAREIVAYLLTLVGAIGCGAVAGGILHWVMPR